MSQKEVGKGWVYAAIVFGMATLFLYVSNDHKKTVIKNLKSKNSDLQFSVSTLKNKVDNFRDGFSNWRDVVREVEEATADLEESATSLSDEIVEFDKSPIADYE